MIVVRLLRLLRLVVNKSSLQILQTEVKIPARKVEVVGKRGKKCRCVNGVFEKTE